MAVVPPNNSPRTIDFGGTPPPTGTPTWAQGFDSAYTYDNGSRNFTVYATSNATNIEVAVNHPGASGAGWTSGQFYALPQQSGNGYTRRRDFNPSSPGQGGISSTGLRLAFRIDGGNGANGVQTNSFTPVSTAALYRPGPITFYPLKPVAPSVGPQTATKGQSYSFTVSPFEVKIGYQTNKSLLDLEVLDIRDGGFSLRNKKTLPGGDWRYFIGSEQRGCDAAQFDNTLRFPQGVPILVEVWQLRDSQLLRNRELDYLRNDGQIHAEQLLIVY